MFLSRELEGDIATLVESLGYSLYDIECTSSRIVIYIDKEEGVSIEDCEIVSRNIDVLLEAENPFTGHYILEVSSPGINRKLKKKEHFDKALNKKCIVKTHREVNDLKVFRGILKGVEKDGIVIETDGGNFDIRFDNIKNAKLDEDIGGKNKV